MAPRRANKKGRGNDNESSNNPQGTLQGLPDLY